MAHTLIFPHTFGPQFAGATFTCLTAAEGNHPTPTYSPFIVSEPRIIGDHIGVKVSVTCPPGLRIVINKIDGRVDDVVNGEHIHLGLKYHIIDDFDTTVATFSRESTHKMQLKIIPAISAQEIVALHEKLRRMRELSAELSNGDLERVNRNNPIVDAVEAIERTLWAPRLDVQPIVARVRDDDMVGFRRLRVLENLGMAVSDDVLKCPSPHVQWLLERCAGAFVGYAAVTGQHPGDVMRSVKLFGDRDDVAASIPRTSSDDNDRESGQGINPMELFATGLERMRETIAVARFMQFAHNASPVDGLERSLIIPSGPLARQHIDQKSS